MPQRNSSKHEARATPGPERSHQWLSQQLRKLYDHVLDEPVPEEMRQIIENYERQRNKRDR